MAFRRASSGRLASERSPWAWYPAAGGCVLACAALAFVFVLQLVQQGSKLETAELVFVPREGMLTRMTHRQMHVLSDRLRPDSRMTQLSGFNSYRHVPSSDSNDLAWAQQLLSTGSSYAERSTETDLVTSHRDGSSYSSRHFGDQRPGYTSVLPESSSSPEDSAYAMAKAIQEHQEEIRNPTAVSRERDTHRSISRRRGSSRLFDDHRRYRETNQPVKELKLRLGPFTSAVSETSPAGDASANEWASQIFRHRNERQMQVQPRARNMELAQTQGNFMFADSRQTRVRTAKLEQLASSQQEADRPKSSYTASIREGPAHHDEKAWGWAADMLLKHRLEKEHAKLYPKPAPLSSAAAVSKPSSGAAVHMSAKLRRKLKLQAARKAIVDVHSTSQADEGAQFQEDLKEENLRVKQIAQREKAEQEAANEGAQEESEEYAAVLK